MRWRPHDRRGRLPERAGLLESAAVELDGRAVAIAIGAHEQLRNGNHLAALADVQMLHEEDRAAELDAEQTGEIHGGDRRFDVLLDALDLAWIALLQLLDEAAGALQILLANQLVQLLAPVAHVIGDRLG